ncbi:aspartate/glutamate racemase family protein [Rhodovulum marinum]|uniref:Asp/Glu/hydantoin racemase n=1 Tax=Rhodovulum marinum TaxID=320662 RepID=A0A4R2Q3H2_9RHOB|nr:aspartate/glutamate racemase family protein [Rhodovulum marinum]TCP42258.1 Asp/Glu/hydantoin racemase [Rhodovulum marinum]
MTPVLLMNPNTNMATTAAMVRIAADILPGITGWTAPRGPEIIVTEAALDAAALVVAGADLPAVRGVIVSAFGDPGRDALARRLACPVIGIGEAAACEARQAGRFAVVTITAGLQGRIDALMQGCAENATYLGCYLTEGDPIDLMADPDALDTALLAASEQAAAAGARTVIIGGGPLGEAADRLESCAPVPLVAPIRAAARQMRDILAQASP